MISQKSYQNTQATLYLVATPIGNFDDMTFRSIEILKSVDYVFAEDTRVTKVLLSHFNINTPLFSYHSYNEDIQTEVILAHLRNGKNIAQVSDAGFPCISDPGFLVAKKAIEEGYNVVAIPGANALLCALVASGISPVNFTFYGFLSSKKNQRVKQLKELINYPQTLIFYEAPHRLKETLQDMYNIFGNRCVTIARELTKKYEEYIRTSLKDASMMTDDLKGEIVLIVEGCKIKNEIKELLEKTIEEHFSHYISMGLLEKEALKRVASDRNVSKSEIYKIIKTNKN